MLTPVLTAFLIASVHAPAPSPAEKKPVRVLLAAGAPTRDYQFARTIFARETSRKQAELSIYLQGIRRGDVMQDVEDERLLRQFPGHLRPLDHPEEKGATRHYNLARYDVIVAFDLDWTQLTPEQLERLESWVAKHGGGLVLVGGPIHTHALARPALREKLKPVLDLYPVVVRDIRVLADRAGQGPWRLNFSGAGADMDFLRLDEERRDPVAGWDDFFHGPKKASDQPALVHGFYSYYPVERVKEGAVVIATFADPKAQLKDGKEQPYLVTMPYGKGRVVWLSAGETWRLRQYRADFHDRFWSGLVRYAGAQRAVP